jgi:Inorganic pyrophosphatase/exopolyphosphatase
VFLLLTDIMKEGSEMLIVSDDAGVVEKAFGAKPVDGKVWLPGVMSRKKGRCAQVRKGFRLSLCALNAKSPSRFAWTGFFILNLRFFRIDALENAAVRHSFAGDTDGEERAASLRVIPAKEFRRSLSETTAAPRFRTLAQQGFVAFASAPPRKPFPCPLLTFAPPTSARRAATLPRKYSATRSPMSSAPECLRAYSRRSSSVCFSMRSDSMNMRKTSPRAALFSTLPSHRCCSCSSGTVSKSRSVNSPIHLE